MDTSPPIEAAVEEFDDFVRTHMDQVPAFERVLAAFGDFAPDESCGPVIERRVQQCVAQGQAASFIRLGDREGNVLALGLDAYPALTAHCVGEASVIDFGAPDVLLQTGSELQQALHGAIRSAEVVGFPGPWVMALLLNMGGERAPNIRSIYGAGAVFAYLERFANELGLAHKLGSSAAFSRRLMPYYRGLIDGRDIGLVSCKEKLPKALRQRMGARSVEFYPVPEQANSVSTSSSDDTGHYPGRYRELLEELRSARPGIVYFVAAGMLGKVYCEAIRAAGGIALDIGAVADFWSGERSRWGVDQETLDRWRVV